MLSGDVLVEAEDFLFSGGAGGDSGGPGVELDGVQRAGAEVCGEAAADVAAGAADEGDSAAAATTATHGWSYCGRGVAAEAAADEGYAGAAAERGDAGDVPCGCPALERLGRVAYAPERRGERRLELDGRHPPGPPHGRRLERHLRERRARDLLQLVLGAPDPDGDCAARAAHAGAPGADTDADADAPRAAQPPCPNGPRAAHAGRAVEYVDGLRERAHRRHRLLCRGHVWRHVRGGFGLEGRRQEGGRLRRCRARGRRRHPRRALLLLQLQCELLLLLLTLEVEGGHLKDLCAGLLERLGLQRWLNGYRLGVAW